MLVEVEAFCVNHTWDMLKRTGKLDGRYYDTVIFEEVCRKRKAEFLK